MCKDGVRRIKFAVGSSVHTALEILVPLGKNYDDAIGEETKVLHVCVVLVLKRIA